ncbi:MAG TPA: efflux transporter outer membrane subunit [Vicinamibacterales bacterium]|jgi:NodT family efflux transporter outer membrane factor (OMF) lipoprotein|nr:efflux transporter outer membrane subunit [Vicinamibacterales bacterium]
MSVRVPVFVIGVIVVSFAACAPKTKYVTPTAPIAPAFKENASWKPPQPRDTEVRGRWWELFDDPQLDDLEGRVDVSNQNVRIAEAQFAQARAFVRGARANLYPQVGASPSIAGVQPSGNRAISSFHDAYADFLLLASVSYEADVWGRLHGIVEANRTAAQATAADVEAARLSLHAELALDYFTLRGLDREQALLDTTVAAYERALELTQNRFQGGLASQADVALAETQLETTRAQAVDVASLRAALEHAIAVLVGQPASALALAPAPLTAAPPAVPVGMPSDLLERRPDVAAAERRVASASAQVGVATAAFYPLLTLSGAGGFESSSIASWLAGASNFWTAGPTMFVNVFDAGRRRAAKEQAIAQYDVATAAYRQSILVAFREVEDQLAALRVLEEEARVQDRAVAASERSLTLANNRYRGGVTSYLEVLTAQSAALANERAAVNILTRRMNATVLLLKGLGGGWSVASLPILRIPD